MKYGNYFKNGIIAFSSLCLIALVSSCDVANNKSAIKKQVSVNMQVATSSANKTNLNTVQQMDSVSLDNIKLLVRKLELKRVEIKGNDQGNENDNNEGDYENEQGEEHGEEFELKNQIFDLPLDGQKISVSTQDVPSGLYKKVELKVGPADPGTELQDTVLIKGDADSLRYSMAISGTYGDSTFTFKTHKDFKFEMAINPPAEVTDSTKSVDINLKIDPSNWFKDPHTGEFLDPTDQDNQEMIEFNIAQSFRAYCHEHNDHEGWKENDHEGDHNGNGDDNNED